MPVRVFGNQCTYRIFKFLIFKSVLPEVSYLFFMKYLQMPSLKVIFLSAWHFWPKQILYFRACDGSFIKGMASPLFINHTHYTTVVTAFVASSLWCLCCLIKTGEVVGSPSHQSRLVLNYPFSSRCAFWSKSLKQRDNPAVPLDRVDAEEKNIKKWC